VSKAEEARLSRSDSCRQADARKEPLMHTCVIMHKNA
jgi:hypothetical protein